MEVAALLAVLAAGLEEARWTPAEAEPWRLGRQPALLLDVPGSEALRVDCPTPTRHLLVDGVLVEDRGEAARLDEDGWWYLPASDPRASQQVVVGVDCRAERLRATASSAGFDHLEHAVDLQQLRAIVEESPVLSDRHRRWLSAATDDAQWRMRYEALRPSRVHQAPGLWPVEPEDGQAVSIDGDRWWDISDTTFQVSGSARLFIEAIPNTVDLPVCLSVDGESLCQLARRDRNLTIQDGDLATRSVDTAQPLIWRVVLDAGEHEISLSDGARVRMTRAPAYATDGQAPATLRQPPARVLIVGPCGDQPCPSPSRRIATHVPPDAVLLSTPSVAWPPTEPSWMALDDLQGLTDLHWQDERGRVGLWFATQEERCTLEIGEQRFQSIPARSNTWFFLDEPAGAALPRSDCPARVRLMMPLPEELLGKPRQILSKMSPLSTILDFAVPDGPDDIQLKLSWPSGSFEPVGVAVTTSSGVRDLVFRPIRFEAGASTADGQIWSRPVVVNLGDDVTHVRFDRPVGALAQLTAPAVPEEAAAPGMIPTVEATSAVEELLTALQQLSASVPIDHQARVDVLMGMGALQFALEERRLVASPLPLRLEPLLTPGMRAHWLSLSGTWLEGDPRTETIQAASVGDFITVAQDPGVAPLDRLLAWRRAILGGQVLSATQRVEAYIALLEAVPATLRDVPVWGSVRALSQWETVRYIEGATRSRWTIAPISEEQRWELRLLDALFPERWPVEETVQLGRGRMILLPPGPALDLPVRCRARRSGTEPFPVTVLDGSGAPLSQTQVPAFEASAVLQVPEGPIRYLRAEQVEAATCQVRLDPALAARLQGRAGWQYLTRPGRPVTVTVLGPTVLRVSGTPGATVEVSAGTEPASVVLSEHGVGEVPIPEAGALDVRVSSAVEQWIRIDMRQPRPASLSPLLDRRLVMEQAAWPTWDVGEPGSSHTTVARPQRGVPVTGVLGAAVDGEPGTEDLQRAAPRLVSQVGVLSRPGSERLWLAGEGAGVALSEEPLRWAKLHVEWAPVRGRWRLGLRTTGQFAQGMPDGTPMNTLKGWSTLSVERWVGERTRLSAMVTATGRADLSAEGRFNYGIHPELWSEWQQDHLTTTRYELQGRSAVSRWVWLAGEASMLQNPIGDGLDRLGGLGWLELSRPGAWLRLGGGSYIWMVDSNRSEARQEPTVQASGWVFLWPSGNLAVQLSGRAAWWPEQDGFSVLLGPTVYFSRDRGLMDLPYSFLVARSAAEWGHDGAAIRRLSGEVQ